MTGAGLRASGVEALIARLHDDGVAAGRAEGARILAAARQQAEALLAAAEIEREAILATARNEADALHRGGETALRLAARDTLNQLRQDVLAMLQARLAAHIAQALEEPALLADLVRLAAARLTGADRRPLEVTVAVDADAEAALVAQLQRDLVAGTFTLLHGESPGIRVSRQGDGTAIDLNVDVLTRHLFERLRPKFRAILDGDVA